MPPKPRPHGKKPKPSRPGGGTDRRLLIGLAAGGLAVLVAVALGIAVAFGGGGGSSDLAASLESAGCTLTTKPALVGVHSIASPGGTSPKWNTDPPTSGPHYEIPAIWGAYTQPLNLAQLVHNLEHGGIFILYGPRVPDATVAQLRSFYDDHTRGTILAPLPTLGDQIALGAWTTKSADEPSHGTAHLAKCTAFDQDAFSTFFDQLQFQGPERFPADTLLPGHN